MGSDRSFAARLSLNILLVTSILFLAAIAIEGVSSHKLIVEEATRSTERLLDATIASIQENLCEVETSVKGATWLASDNIENRNYMYGLTTRMVNDIPDVVGSAVAYRPEYFKGEHWVSPYSYSDPESGKVMTKNLGNETYDYFTMDWYEPVALNGQPHWSEPYVDEGGSGYLMTTYSYPILDENWDVTAVMTADLSLQWIADKLSQIKPYKNSTVSLISRKGKYLNITGDSALLDQDIYSTLKMAGSPEDLSAIVESIMKGEKGVKQYRRGKKVSFVVYGPLDNGWSASITCGYDEVLAGASKMLLHLIINALASLLLQFLLGFFIIRKVSRPLTSMSEAAISISNGNFNTELPEVKHKDEIYQLRDSFDVMQKSLNAYIENLKESTAANERYASELQVAANIQMAMVPKEFPHNDRIDLEAFIKPAKEVGGDLYDYHINGDTLYFLVGDVSGKGVPASLIMAMTLFAFRLLGPAGFEVNEVVESVNDCVSSSNNTGMFVTLFYGRINLKTHEMSYCNAGHNPIVVVQPGEAPYYLQAKSNLALGVMDGFKYEKQTLQLTKGSRLVVYTDGVTEAEREDKCLYGEPRLLDWTKAACDAKSATAFNCQSLLEDIHNFTLGNEQNDDITIMTMTV